MNARSALYIIRHWLAREFRAETYHYHPWGLRPKTPDNDCETSGKRIWAISLLLQLPCDFIGVFESPLLDEKDEKRKCRCNLCDTHGTTESHLQSLVRRVELLNGSKSRAHIMSHAEEIGSRYRVRTQTVVIVDRVPSSATLSAKKTAQTPHARRQRWLREVAALMFA